MQHGIWHDACVGAREKSAWRRVFCSRRLSRRSLRHASVTSLQKRNEPSSTSAPRTISSIFLTRNSFMSDTQSLEETYSWGRSRRSLIPLRIGNTVSCQPIATLSSATRTRPTRAEAQDAWSTCMTRRGAILRYRGRCATWQARGNCHLLGIAIKATLRILGSLHLAGCGLR